MKQAIAVLALFLVAVLATTGTEARLADTSGGHKVANAGAVYEESPGWIYTLSCHKAMAMQKDAFHLYKVAPKNIIINWDSKDNKGRKVCSISMKVIGKQNENYHHLHLPKYNITYVPLAMN